MLLTTPWPTKGTNVNVRIRKDAYFGARTAVEPDAAWRSTGVEVSCSRVIREFVKTHIWAFGSFCTQGEAGMGRAVLAAAAELWGKPGHDAQMDTACRKEVGSPEPIQVMCRGLTSKPGWPQTEDVQIFNEGTKTPKYGLAEGYVRPDTKEIGRANEGDLSALGCVYATKEHSTAWRGISDDTARPVSHR